ncbi:MAG: DUF4911 domain-containing protein [Synergistaceae bacterium]|jgi:hypothetical protein|nr:DUF4911 domain-containing protein [Synergistaceae bacterium]
MERFVLKIPRKDICYVSWTIDAYEGTAFLKNEREEGVVSIFCPPCQRDETERIIAALKREGVAIERLGQTEQTEDNLNGVI